MAAMPSKGDRVEFTVRMTSDLRDALQLLAKSHDRSGSDEAIVALKAHLQTHAAELKRLRARAELEPRGKK